MARSSARCATMPAPARPPFPAEVARQIESLIGVRVLLTYGATEYTQNVTQAPRDGDPKFGSPGIRLPYTQVKTVELDGDMIKRECGTDEIGVVVVKGPSITPGYLEPKYNEGVFTRDGWFNSGDLGRLDADGYLWLTGRVKDVIIRSGHNIDPSVIEETLLKHHEVMLAAAVSKPDAYAGELPIAYVQLVPGRARIGRGDPRLRPRAHSGAGRGAEGDRHRREDAADRRAEARQGASFAATPRAARSARCWRMSRMATSRSTWWPTPSRATWR